MEINNGEFKTNCCDKVFVISITQESDLSQDGGHTFEDVTNSYELNKYDAQHLIDELNIFLKNFK